MQVDSRLPSGVYHGYPQTQVNGTHSSSRPNYSPSSTTHSRDSDMHPYPQHPYAAGPPASQPRQYSSTQLPPMYPGMGVPSISGQASPGVPGPSNVPHGLTYNPNAAPYQTSTQSVQHQDQQAKPALSGGGTNGKHHFRLVVEQEPQRARMCGFGDKDRRPITPPPCVRLIITDNEGNRVPASEVNGTFFVLQVDLWDQNATREVNIVRSSSNSPAVSISTATTTSYPPLPDRPPVPDYGRPVGYTADGAPLFQAPQGYPPGTMVPYPTGYSGYYPGTYGNAGPAGPSAMGMSGNSHAGGQSSTSMYTRNLIGSLTVNASKLKDVDGEESHWFILQDLSVRTEGWFRLKMNFIDVANPTDPSGETLHKGKCPVLAYIFSEQFQVYSAKKFPGVIESTPLSKCFAGQGIKIPIRKDLRMEEVPDED